MIRIGALLVSALIVTTAQAKSGSSLELDYVNARLRFVRPHLADL